ncbi:hypothetical protein ACRW9N_08015 [Listeria aquatica]|uniref:hypothetical protein n=1 Tax=Listeria aquatica TaxID=1494960 RepID=UPI0004B1F197
MLRRIKQGLLQNKKQKEENASLERELQELRARMHRIQQQIYSDKERRLIKPENR